MDSLDTIAAVASAAGGAVRGIVRICGEGALRCVEPLIDAPGRDRLNSLCAAAMFTAPLRLPEFRAPVPCEVYVWPGTRSYTRLPTVELHVLGSPPTVEAVLAAACRAGARPAKPGEFTLRAFLAGRIDLTQAEAVLGVIDANDDRDLKTALAQMAGGLAEPLTRLRNELLDLTAHLEAGLDFVEEDIEFVSRGELLAQLGKARSVFDAVHRQIESRGDVGGRPKAVLVGAPNAGKSSLFNALISRDQALVSPTAGTTRDYLTATLDCGGIEIELVDTAGLSCEKIDRIDALAQRGTKAQAEQAALRLLCFDISHVPTDDDIAKLRRAGPHEIVVWTKCDGPKAVEAEAISLDATHVATSIFDGASLQRLSAEIARRLRAISATDGEVVGATAERCRASVRHAAEFLERAEELVRGDGGEELVAAELRGALQCLGEIVGVVYTDDILDRIFSRFCIGK